MVYSRNRWGYRRWLTLSSLWPIWLEPWLLTLILSQPSYIGRMFFQTKLAVPRQMWDNLLSIHPPYLHSFTGSCSSPSHRIVRSFHHVSHPYLSFIFPPSLPPSLSSLPHLPPSPPSPPSLSSLPLLPPSLSSLHPSVLFCSLILLILSLTSRSFTILSSFLPCFSSSHPPPTPNHHPRLSSSGFPPDNLSRHQPQWTLRDCRRLARSQALLIKQYSPMEHHWSVQFKWDQSDDSSLWRS